MTTQKAGELLSENMRTLYLWSLHKTSDPYKAEDLCSDIMLAVMQSAPNLKYDDAFFGFVWKVAANTYKYYLRKLGRETHSELDENIPDTEDMLLDLCDCAQFNTLRRELAFMTERYRICTVAYYYDQMSIKEIAEKYGITPQTVKFNLFQSRKILKEGIAMERQFGEKSFKPQPFNFQTIVWTGNLNDHFNNLFNRKLTGQILLSAYYEPMTVDQLSVELGVANVYLEDEVRLLENYGFLKKHGEKKYQASLLILTKSYIDAIFDKLDEEYQARLKDLIDAMRVKLPAVRAVGFTGSGLKDNLILWDLLAYSCIKAFWAVGKGCNNNHLYDNTSGVCYACGYNDEDIKYPYQSFSGTFNFNDHHCGSKINFNGHRQHEDGSGFLDNDETFSGDYFPVFEKEELNKVLEILDSEFESMKLLMSDIAQLTIDTLKEHSPECAYELIDAYCPHITLWDLCGWFGAAAENTGALERPAEDELAGIIGYTFTP